jgi:hypothetical protein
MLKIHLGHSGCVPDTGDGLGSMLMGRSEKDTREENNNVCHNEEL